MFGKAAGLRGVNRACKPHGTAKFVFCGRKIGQDKDRSRNVPVNRENSRVQRRSCSLREADVWQELRPTGRRSPAIILLGSSCRAICSCPRRNLIPRNLDSTDHRAAAETHIQMGRTDQLRHRHRGEDRSSSPIEVSPPPEPATTYVIVSTPIPTTVTSST